MIRSEDDEKTDFLGYSPQNYKNKYLGWASAKDCLKYFIFLTFVYKYEIHNKKALFESEEPRVELEREDRDIIFSLE